MNSYIFTNNDEFDTQNNRAIYNLFLDYKEKFLNNGYSIFDDSLQLFDDNEVFEEFERRIIKNYDSSKKDNKTKYKLQLKGADKKFRHFFAHIIYLYFLPMYEVKKKTKKEEIEEYLQSDEISKSLFRNKGFAAYGAMKKFKYYDVNFIYFFVKQYHMNKDNPIDIITNINLFEKICNLTDENVKNMKSLASKHMLKFLFEPDFYEPIVNTTAKREIVKFFLNKYNESTLDDDIYKIREDDFGFTKSIYFHVYNHLESNKVKKGKLSFKINKSDISSLSFVPTNYDTDEDIIDKERNKLKNGLKAEELVYKSILENLNPAKRSSLIELVKEEFKDRNFDEVSQGLDKFIYYSKNINRYAPFDLIDYKNNDFLFIEVKSTTRNIIYFSKAEIIFAYENKSRYQLNVVKDNVIYIVDYSNEIEKIYSIMQNNNIWSFNTVEFIVEFTD